MIEQHRSLAAIKASIDLRKLSLTTLVQAYLDNIEASKDLHIFLEVFGDEALENAIRVQEKMDSGSAGALAGMVVAIKDNIAYKDHRLGAASKILEGFNSLYTATALQRLIDADAIIIGRLNCDEFAMGGSNENSAYGVAKNPLDKAYVPGGSSGGSAAAVAADCCLAALGSDTGGSIRQPASFCGVVGLKPTYGRISRHGLIAFASSFDQIGPLTHTVADAALLTEVMSGRDAMDNTSSSEKLASYATLDTEQKPLRIGYVEECIRNESLDPAVRKRTEAIMDSLRAAGHTLKPVHIEELKYLVPAYYVLTTAEASSNLSRYDGIHYGHRSDKATDIESTYVKSRSEGFTK